MSRRRKLTDTTPFDTLRLEGTLFVPELLERAASGDATAQKEADYAIPRGLKIHDEYGRAFRIATASWQAFAPQFARADLDPLSTTQTFVLGFLRQCLDYVDITPLLAPIALGDRAFPISAQAIAGRLPVIIAPHNLGLDDPDQRFAILGSGTRRKSAHQLAQEFLNADRNSLWAIVTNGKTLRLLRDADTLTRPNFLEFDLETILRDEQQRYADFAALWRILHASRAGAATTPTTDCIWEKWKSEGHAQGLRIRDGLRDGVQEALLILGTGFLTHRENDSLRQRLHDGALTKEDYFQQLLRLIYRCLFLFCSEERDLLHPHDASTTARQAYATGYSLRRLRTRSLRQSAHDPHGDLWQSVRITFSSLATGQPRLGLPALGGLFAQVQCADVDGASLTNRDLLSAMKHLRWFFDKKTGQRGAIDYRNMGPEELGSVYESLLELVPQLNLPARSFGFAGISDSASTSGNARKTTGSYYTPDSLVQELIKSALDPVIADRLAAQPDRPIDALLSITVCDPSCGSGHFLLAAARRLAEKLAELRAPDGAVHPDDYRHALREVASRCLYGVDINPMAVELCRVALWLETVDPGKPLGFLNHHIRTGNSLLGTTPDLIAAGLPDDTFTAIEGDEKAACAELKKRNKKEREGFGPLFEQEEQTIRDRLRQAATQIEAMDDSQPTALQQKEAAFTTSETGPEYRHAKLLADLWCAAFVIKKHYPVAEGEASSAPSSISDLPSPIEGHLLHTEDDLFGQPKPASVPKAASKKQPRTKNQEQGIPSGITTAHLRDFVQGQALPEPLEKEVAQLASQYRFFHWHLAFPQVFDQGGFACILGNPPWERIQVEALQFFASRRPQLLSLNRSEREAALVLLEHSDPALHSEWINQRRTELCTTGFLKGAGRFPLSTQKNVNSYAVFTELGLALIAPTGQLGVVSQSGIATDDIMKPLFQRLIREQSLVSFYDFENRENLFSEVHSSFKFCLLTAAGNAHRHLQTDFVFFAGNVDDLREDSRHLTLSEHDLSLLNPNTETCSTFRSPEAARLCLSLYAKHPVLIRESNPAQNLWATNIRRMFDMAYDSGLFREESQLRNLGGASKEDGESIGSPIAYRRLYEAKMIHQFDHRFASFANVKLGLECSDVSQEEKKLPSMSSRPRYWVETSDYCRKMAPTGWIHRWIVAFREIARATDERTSICAILPDVGIGHTCYTLTFSEIRPSDVACFVGNGNSFCFDWIARQKLPGTHLSVFILKQLPVLRPATYTQPCPWANVPKSKVPNPPSLRDWLLPRVLELTYTAWDLEAFAADCGWSGPPFRWDEERRFLLRCELDAAFFHLYLGPQSEWQQQPEALTRAFPTPRHAVSYIMDTFPIVKRKDEAKHGHYRTKETILQYYDEQALCSAEGRAFQNAALSFPPADVRVTHDPRLPAGLRPAFKSEDYFPLLLPLITKFQPDGVEAGRLLHALEILSESEARRTALKGHTGEPWKAWAEGFPKKHRFSDAAAALLHQLGNGTLIRWRDRVSFATEATFVDNEWLRIDAFIALRLAVAAPTALVEHKIAETKKHFPVLFNLLLAAA